MKTSLIVSLGTAALITAACGGAKAEQKTDAPADTSAKPAEAHCGAEKGAHEGTCGAPPAADAAAPAPAADAPK